MLANLTEDNQIALQQAAAALAPGARYFEVSGEDGRIVLTPVSLSDAEAARAWAPALVKTAHSWLAQADREFEAERDLVAGRYLWEAVRAAVTAAGIKRGVPVNDEKDMFAFVVQLDKEDGGGYKHLVRFGVAQSLRDQANGRVSRCGCDVDVWDESEFESGRRAAKSLIDYLSGLAGAGTLPDGTI